MTVRQKLHEIPVRHADRSFSPYPFSLDVELRQAAECQIEWIDPDAVVADCQVAAHDPGQQENDRLRPPLVALIRRDPRVDAAHRKINEPILLVGLPGNCFDHASGAVFIHEIAEMRNLRALMERVARAVSPFGAAEH